VAKYEELSLARLYPKVIDRHPELLVFFPHYKQDYIPTRSFFWKIYCSQFPLEVELILTKSHKKRVNTELNQPGEMIMIRNDVLQELEKASFVSSKLLLFNTE
jgi:hypothetical protein